MSPNVCQIIFPFSFLFQLPFLCASSCPLCFLSFLFLYTLKQGSPIFFPAEHITENGEHGLHNYFAQNNEVDTEKNKNKPRYLFIEKL